MRRLLSSSLGSSTRADSLHVVASVDRASASLKLAWSRVALSCVLAWGTAAQALTLGPAVVQSALGEPLRAEFPITRLSDAEARDLQVRLADDNAFTAARLERAPALEGAALSIETRPDGRRALVVKGQQAVQAPFVDLLVELRWTGGRQLRDLTVLLQAQASDKPASLPPSRLIVQAGDTAGQLARDHKDDQVSLEQMLVALLKQNPEAFIDGNVNRLRSGALLALPSAAEANSVEREAAREALLEQAEAFDSWRAGLAQRVTASDAPDSGDDTRIPLTSRKSATSGSPQDRLELTKPGSGQEDRIALQRQAQDTAERAAELARNIAELGKIAGGQAAGDEARAGVPLPAADVPPHGRLIDVLRDHPLTPIGAAVLVAALVLMSLWRTRVRQASSASTASDAGLPSTSPLPPLPPLPITVDLELPRLDTPLPEDAPGAGTVMRRSNTSSALPSGHAVDAARPAGATQAPRPATGSPFAGLSLDLSDHPPAADGNFPFANRPQDVALGVRLELAQALWEAGQLHTARALAEEVLEQSQGRLQQQAREWLAGHA
jgi:pilus assembly protein FimV